MCKWKHLVASTKSEHVLCSPHECHMLFIAKCTIKYMEYSTGVILMGPTGVAGTSRSV